MGAVSFNLETPSASLLAGNVGFLTGFEHIESVTVGSGGSSSVSFTGIPQYYRHLQVRSVVRTSSAAQTAGEYMAVSANIGSGTYYHGLYGDGTSSTSINTASIAAIQRYATAFNSANIFGVSITDILDYASSSKNKTLRNLGGYDANGSGRVYLDSSFWNSTAAITSITLTPGNGTFLQFSTFALYGIR